MTLLDEPVRTFEVEPEPPAPRTLLARAVPIVVVFALLGLIGTAGTWASFNATTDNPATLSTGSLVLANTVTGGSEGTCYSDDDSGIAVNASECEAVFDVPAQQPGNAPVEDTVTLENVGTMNAAALSVYAPDACSSPLAGSYNGSVSLCTKLQLVIQEYSDAGFNDEVSCIYGAGDGTTCQFDASLTVDQFVSDHGDFASGVAIGDLQAGAANRRYFRVAAQLADDTDNNSVQGREAVFSLTWRIEQ